MHNFTIDRMKSRWRDSVIRPFRSSRGVAAGTASSFLVRCAGMANTLVAMPIALHTLGVERFGTFLLLFGVINWITLGSFGVQNALGRAIASKTVQQEQVPDLLGAALVYAAVTTGLTAFAVTGAFYIWKSSVGNSLHVPLREVTTAATLMIVMSTLQIMLQAFEGTRIGNLQLYAVNFTRLAGSLFSFICLMVLPIYWSTMSIFVIALNGGLLLGAVLNALIVLQRIRPRFRHLKRDIESLRSLAWSGLAYLIIGVASLFQTHVPVLILASLKGPSSAVDLGLFIRLLFVQMTAVGMVTAPFWPALLHARAEGDLKWARKSVALSALIVVGVGLVFFVFVGVLGRELIWIWTRRSLDQGWLFQFLIGSYFFQMAWTHYWGVVLMGCGQERYVSRLLLIEALVTSSLSILFTSRFGAVGTVAGMVLGMVLVSNWLMPIAARRELVRAGILSSRRPGINL